ncbi:GFA family protein [Massilia forsythiae]|uniref:GFA family protein n=2 Tax=Massilia forsythiae TaxID=2728020 RepID=A0A7Z2ZVN9_9BURK|nr:GFA family protein [Massilia forsythiae]
MVLRGGCACGAVRYEAAAAPFHRTLCHCADCRRAAGAPAVAWFSVPAAALAWVRGAPRRHRSSAAVERAFCGRCGTQLTYRHDDIPGEVDITTCSLDDPEQAAPQDHTFAARRLRWLRVDDGLPVYPATRAAGMS